LAAMGPRAAPRAHRGGFLRAQLRHVEGTARPVLTGPEASTDPRVSSRPAGPITGRSRTRTQRPLDPAPRGVAQSPISARLSTACDRACLNHHDPGQVELPSIRSGRPPAQVSMESVAHRPGPVPVDPRVGSVTITYAVALGPSARPAKPAHRARPWPGRPGASARPVPASSASPYSSTVTPRARRRRLSVRVGTRGAEDCILVDSFVSISDRGDCRLSFVRASITDSSSTPLYASGTLIMKANPRLAVRSFAPVRASLVNL